jgi:hypothetical protein
MRKIGVLAGMVMAAAAGVAAAAAGAGNAPSARQTEVRTQVSKERPAAAPSVADHAKAAIRQYRSGTAFWRPAPTKHKHRSSGERAHRRWRRRRATGRHRK